LVAVSVKHLELSRSWQEQQELAAMTNKKLVSLKKLHHQDDELGQRIDEVDRSRVTLERWRGVAAPNDPQ